MTNIDSIAWDKIKSRYDELSNEISTVSDNNKRIPLQKELSYLSDLLSKYEEIQKFEKELSSLVAQRSTNKDPELDALYEEEISQLNSSLKSESDALENLMFPADPLDDRSVFLEIRAGAGGLEASLFAADLMRMYMNYGLKKNWSVTIADLSQTDLKGYREVVLHIEGKGVYAHLKYESGVHRVQRVPATETSGRVHTSTITVAVLPEAEEVDVNINPADLKIDTYRAGGAGGQHVNKTESAIRITHIPSGVVVTCQEERSQHKNKARALKMLQSRLLGAQKEKQEAEVGQKRKEQVGTGMRAEKVRTYNFPQNRVSDHQVELTLNKLDRVIEGDLDEIINALMEKDRTEKRKQPFKFNK